jgi:hypothetical protein
MSGPEGHRRPAVPTSARLALGAALTAALALAPAAAHADGTQANTWSGGGLPAEKGAGGRAAYPRSGVLVSIVTGVPRARVDVQVFDPRCGMGGTATSGAAAVVPGGDGLYQALSVSSRRTQRYASRYGTTTLTATVALSPAAPGVLGGTVRVTGTTHDVRRPYRCDLTLPVVVRSHQSVLVPRAPGIADPAAPRTGLVDVTMPRRVPGSIVITRRTDRRLHAMWSIDYRCRAGSRRYDAPAYETSKRFAVRSDGSFRGTERGTRRGTDGGDRYVYRFTSRITGRIGSDGIARGRVSNTSSTTWPGGERAAASCSTGSRRFLAAP